VGRKRLSKERRVEGEGNGQEEGPGKRALKEGPEEYDAAGRRFAGALRVGINFIAESISATNSVSAA